MTRRQALAAFASWASASPLLSQNQPMSKGEPPGRIAPLDELVNSYEFAQMAERSLAVREWAKIADSPREFFDRITFRMRLMVNTENLDLTANLLGQELFTPIVVGPAAHQKRFHPEGELAMAAGCASAKAMMTLSADSDVSSEQVSASAATICQATSLATGSKAVCLPPTIGGWDEVKRARESIQAPLILKGVMSPPDAQKAADLGVNAILISNYGAKQADGQAHPMSVLESISTAVGDRVEVLIDGGFRRGSDILKAMALGAHGVMITRPALWGLAAYGEEGVRTVIEMLQTELAANMAMLGAPNLAAVTRKSIRIHSR